ncbi:MAG: pyridoxine 5'-phosphate synthase [Candidatus Goldiibacteriota bacterium]
MAELCVNIDHIATLRQARGEDEPDVIKAARIAEKAGAAGITVHLREDRRHIQDKDVLLLRKTVKKKLNLEMAVNEEIIKYALKIIPDEATLVPEKRKELTTEGGLDVVKNIKIIEKTAARLKKKGIAVSLFIDPEEKQIKAAAKTGVQFIEIHTGSYANAGSGKKTGEELKKIKNAVDAARGMGLRINAGHGLNYANTRRIARIPGIEDLNTGHSIISRAVFTGFEKAVKDMLELVKG